MLTDINDRTVVIDLHQFAAFEIRSPETIVVLVPPDVYEPAPHTEQFIALFALHRLSAPQSSQPL